MTDPKIADPSGLRFIAMDMDGTILDAVYQLSPRVARTLNHLQTQGKKLIIATGRTYAGAHGFLKGIFSPDAFVCTNGADIYGPHGMRIANHHIPREVLPALAATGRRHASDEVLFCWYVGDQWMYEHPSAMVDFYERRSGIKGLRQNLDSLKGQDTLKFLAIGPHETLLLIREEIVNAAPGPLETVFSHETMLEIMASGVSKRHGLEECLRSLGGTLEETVAFGDAENDLEMLKAVKVGVAMGNAHSSIQTQVPFVTESVDEDGVARFLEYIFGL
jgi:hypothetical protein